MNRFVRNIALLGVVTTAPGLWMPDDATAADDRPANLVIESKMTGMKLTWIRAGGFEMGSLPSEEGHTRQESPHTVRITRPFYIGVYEVTQADFETVMEANPGAFSAKGQQSAAVADVATARFPVENVSWFDAIEFCNELSDKDGLKPYYGLTVGERVNGSIKSAVVSPGSGSGYRLPTEAEWEYACRAGTTTAYNSGETATLLKRAAWFGGSESAAGNSDQRTHRVGQRLSNDYGLFDMHGNVAEWCYDWYDYSTYERSSTNDPVGPTGGSKRVVRGGSWNDEAVHCRSADRFAFSPGQSGSSIGFRVVRSMPTTAAVAKAGVPPFRVVMDLRDGGTVDVFRNESYDSFEAAKERLANSKLFGKIDSLRIIDANGNKVEE